MIKKRIKSTNMELTPAISDYIDKKVDVIKKFIDDNVEILAEIEVGKTTKHHHKGDIFRAEINVVLFGQMFRAVSETSDLYAAIDEMKDNIVREIERHKRKKNHLLRRGGQKIKNFLKGITFRKR